MTRLLLFGFILIVFSSSINAQQTPRMTYSQAQKLIQLPLSCIGQEYPNKLSQTLASSAEIGTPAELHPIFFGCYDWHSCVHGYWSIVKLIKWFPALDTSGKVVKMLEEKITKENVQKEIEYFQRKTELTYERTYGWAWLFQLQGELKSWNDPRAIRMSQNLQPLTDLLVSRLIEFLPKLIYPLRVGQHNNTAFGLSLTLDYAIQENNQPLINLINQTAVRFFQNDKICPIEWEPSGNDFLSPCLQEIDLMRKVLDQKSFKKWLKSFSPDIVKGKFKLEPAKVSDRNDGYLIHLDGLNFSRAWVIYGLAYEYPELKYLIPLADTHFNYSYPNLFEDTYEGGHWLGTYAIYALSQRQFL